MVAKPPEPEGVPEITPVVEFMSSPGGRLDANHEGGKMLLLESCAVQVKDKATPAFPEAVDALVINGELSLLYMAAISSSVRAI